MSVAITATHDDKPQTGATTTFSFKVPQVPSGALKQRRVSLALPQAPRVVEGWKFRDDTGLNNAQAEPSGSSSPSKMKKSKSAANANSGEGDSNDDVTKEKKPRKKWTMEETQMLVDGCNKHGVGNWKTILRDPALSFDNRSPVDLKDRFRTYFPDAYKQHYPNAKTHLSSKVRSTLPDGSSLFEKTRSKRRRPFTEEEDRALKEGYEKYGTVWATIVKDYPIFQEQNRRSTDLRDRFRNAFPDLYQQAGYKPRNTKKKQTAAVDDQQLSSTGGPVRSRKRAYTHRGGTKSVPQSRVGSEDEGSGDESESPSFSPFKAPPTPPSMKAVAAAVRDKTPSPEKATDDEDEEMDILTLDPLAEALSLPDIGGHHEGEWSSGVNTPTHSNHWSTAAGSPTSSHLSSDLPVNSPFMARNPNNNNNFGMIGKSAWGPDWFSPNPRLDPSSSTVGQNSSSSYFEHSSPASPFSFHQLNYGVVDRYDLFPSTVPNDIASEGAGEAHSTFSDDDDSSLLFQANRGFTHHSSSAGDLIFGARTAAHQGYGFSSLSSAAVSAVGGGSSSFGFGGGLGLNFGSTSFQQQSQQQQQQAQQQHQNAGVHPMQLHAHASPMLDDAGPDPLGIPLPDAMDEDLEDATSNSVLSDGAHKAPQLKTSHRLSVPRMPIRASTTPQPHRHDQQVQAPSPDRDSQTASLSAGTTLDHPSNNVFNLDDLVDLSNDLHTTPPATPLTHPRPMRRSSVSTVQHFGGVLSDPNSINASRTGRAEEMGDGSLQARSISVPPSEYRNLLYVPGTTSLDGGYASALVDFESMHGMGGAQPLDMSVLRQIHPFHSLMAGATQHQQQTQQQPVAQGQQHRPGPNAVTSIGSRSDPRPMLLDVRGRTGQQHHSHQQQSKSEDDEDDQDGEEESELRPQTPTLASRHLLSPSLSSSRHLHAATPMSASLSSSSTTSTSTTSSSISSVSTSSSSSSSSLSSALSLDDTWRNSFLPSSSVATSHASLAADIYNLPFLDLHYYGSGTTSTNGNTNPILTSIHPGMVSGDDELGGFIDMQAQALDLARSSMGTPSTAVFGSFSGINSKVPVGNGGLGQQQGMWGQARHMQAQQHLNQAFGPSMTQSMAPPSQHHLHQHQQQGSPWNAHAFGGGKGTLGRSQSHHRGQSQHVLSSHHAQGHGHSHSATVNPADLGAPMAGVEGVRKKRMSWDGMSI